MSKVCYCWKDCDSLLLKFVAIFAKLRCPVMNSRGEKTKQNKSPEWKESIGGKLIIWNYLRVLYCNKILPAVLLVLLLTTMSS